MADLLFYSSCFWNLVGAGIFGFLINPPVALYYMQGLNTTAVHGHTALFGVYGMLGIGLMLFVLRDMDKTVVWKDRYIKFAFWSINIGLATMVLFSVLPIGLAQTVASVREGLWYARSAEFLQQPYMITFEMDARIWRYSICCRNIIFGLVYLRTEMGLES